jgi:ubiquinone/menaquinone biosynthesis C-methylase UbiE
MLRICVTGAGPYAGVMALDAAGARRFYDRMGRWQDTQRFYEDEATTRLIRASDLAQARSVFELGCGTGRFASRLFSAELPSDARYLGVDVSPEMVRLSSARLAAWGPRAQVQLLEAPALVLPGADGSCDRFLATYVLDLLSGSDAAALVGEAHRLLAPDGLLGLVSLTHGTTFGSRLLAGSWAAVANRWPALVGGCRPIALSEIVGAPGWRVVHHEVIVSWWVPSELLVAAREQAA